MTLRRTSLALLAILMACAFAAGPAHAATFTVNSTSDLSDLTPGDGICDADETPAVACTLRAAVQETNALNDIAPSHTINLPAGTYPILNGALVVTWNLDLVGAGTRSTFIARPTNSNVAPSRIFEVEGRSANISRVSISGGIADATNNFFGGNIRVQDGNLTLSETKVSGGSGSSGGGISNVRGTLNVFNSTIVGNAADTGGGDSGAIQNFGDANGAATLLVQNSTIHQNTARLGGGILSGGNAANSVTVQNSTVTNNNSGDRGGGGGLLISTGSANVDNSIVALNSGGASAPNPNCSVDVGATLTSLGHNIENGTECGFTAAGDKQNTDPKLGALQNAGGPTDTRPLLGGSPAIDAGNPSTCTPLDQWDVARQGICDIGAFEFTTASAPETVIVSGPTVVTTDRTPTFTFSSAQPGTTFECSLNNAPFVACA